MATVHSYKRFSTIEQADGDSEKRQDDAAAKFCKEYGHTLSKKKFFDAGKSGWRGNKQKALDAFLKAIDNGDVQPGDILLVEAIDRLSRKGIRETQKLVNHILDAGVDIAIVTPMTRIFKAGKQNELGDAIELVAFAYTAYVYSEVLSGRIKSHWRDQRKEIVAGKKFSANCPNWLRWNSEKQDYEEIPEATAAIKHIFKRAIEGIGGGQMCRELNAEWPIVGRRKNSVHWNKTYIRMILTSRRILGEHQQTTYNDKGKPIPEGEPIKGYYPAIVDEDTWLTAQGKIANRKIERGPRGNFVNLWTGIISHAIDKCPIHIYTFQQKRADGRKVTYRRLKSYRMVSNEPGASSETVKIEDFDNAVLSYLDEINPDVLGNKKPRIDISAKRSLLTKKQNRINECEVEIENGVEDVGTLMRVIGNLKADVKAINTEIKKLITEQNTDHKRNLDTVRKLVKMADTPEQRQKLSEAIKQVVSRITILPIKLGPLKKSPVACIAEVEFHHSNYRKLIIFCGSNQMAMKGHKFPTIETPLLETPKIRLKVFAAEWRRLIPQLAGVKQLVSVDD